MENPIKPPFSYGFPEGNTCGFRDPALEPGSNAAACACAHATHARRAAGPAGSAAGDGCNAARGGTGTGVT